jgi:hypothetical protein
LQEAIDQGGFAVVDVGDNGDVAKFHDAAVDAGCARQCAARYPRKAARPALCEPGTKWPKILISCGAI